MERAAGGGSDGEGGDRDRAAGRERGTDGMSGGRSASGPAAGALDAASASPAPPSADTTRTPQHPQASLWSLKIQVTGRVEFGDFSCPSTSSIEGQRAKAPAELSLARRLHQKRKLTIVCTPEFNAAFALQAKTRTNPLEVRQGGLERA